MNETQALIPIVRNRFSGEWNQEGGELISQEIWQIKILKDNLEKLTQ